MMTKLQASRLESIASGIWAIDRNRFYGLLSEASAKPDELAENEASIKAARRQTSNVKGAVAVIPIHGVMAQHEWDWYGDTSTDHIGGMVDAAVNDSEVGALVLDIDSPGGIVFGVQELWTKITQAKTQKPVIAVVNSMAASAAYYAASAASEIVMTDGGLAGSIGTLSMHVDASVYLENEGLKVTFVHAGKYKVEGNEFEPLGEEARAEIQSMVDGYYGQFVSAVAAGRRVSEKRVKEEFGQGRMFRSQQAVAVGLVDRIGTLESVVQKLLGDKGRTAAIARAADMRKRELQLRAMGL